MRKHTECTLYYFNLALEGWHLIILWIDGIQTKEFRQLLSSQEGKRSWSVYFNSFMVSTKLAINHVKASQSGTIFNTVVFIENH